MLTKKVQIINKLGLHARASSKLVSLASNFNSELKIVKDNKTANLKSIMGVMMLAASNGSEVTLIADGIDEEQAVNEVIDLISNKFGEAE
jgi:phosphocarrier protein